jgi:hypothetical protein
MTQINWQLLYTTLCVQKSWRFLMPIVYPAHGAGSACGKNMKETVSTIGNQKRITPYVRIWPKPIC